MEELIRISGLSHGTDVWVGNTQDLVHAGVPLSECICTRDDIMNALIDFGVDSEIAFKTMESVRKGKGLQPFMEAVSYTHLGTAGLSNVWTALSCCERVLLANKEALVAGGDLVMERARALNRLLLPVDSEHSAIFQCLRAREGNPVRHLILTASGGALRDRTAEEIENASVEDVLRHPTWRMGAKITVDCATMLNKGLEVIEAHYLFGMDADKIRVVVHPESVVHSMVEFEDGAVLAQLGNPDMRGPIGYACLLYTSRCV